ncbi:secreted protein containing Na-Ca exchanger/integrin-beta4 domain protein [Candidatus Magnetomorum sp. HK-1]|nr:secreted protein containing Na-Ca exchanger/integrin-beta4 domain protein [Candidatus Magnetomorum sp. HK-1]
MKELSLLILFWLLFIPIQANASPELSLNTTTISPGESATLILSISNAPDCAGINAKILFPDGLSVKSISRGSLLPANFTIDFRSFSDAQGQGIFVLAYSNLDTFTNASGELLKINLETTDNIVGGNYDIPFANTNLNTLVNARYAVSNSDGTDSLNTNVISGKIDIFPVIEFTKSTQSVTENAGTVSITANMNCTSHSMVTVPFTVSGTSDDHNLSNGTLTIEPGTTSGLITFDIQDDQNNESEETVIITMDEPSGAKWGNTTIHVINVLDDDNYNVKPYNLDVDQNGSVDGGTDGLLLIRYLFENTGENLVKSVVANNCNRCEVMDIENYLNDAKSAILDVDGNGQADGGTDGLLLIRYIFENRGENLIRGVVASDCTRCTAEEIENYLAPLCP